ncbi:MAG TPA: hypothetical protein VLE73_02850 [Candidatus Saccharimonadales bacterium]|nr:hypothetical protein [Candidatus Saccharimonadales bacterium]
MTPEGYQQIQQAIGDERILVHPVPEPGEDVRHVDVLVPFKAGRHLTDAPSLADVRNRLHEAGLTAAAGFAERGSDPRPRLRFLGAVAGGQWVDSANIEQKTPYVLMYEDTAAR